MRTRLAYLPQTSVHDMSPFSFLSGIVGLPAYASRALVIPGTVVAGYASETSRHDMERNHAWMRKLGIGAETLITVPSEDIRTGILETSDRDSYLERIRQTISRDQPLSLFLSRDMEPLVQALGLPWKDVASPHPSVSNIFDGKHSLRCLATKLNVDHGFPAWEFVSSNFDNLLQTRKRVLTWARDNHAPTEYVFLKAHDMDGGAGVMRWGPQTSEQEVAEFATKYLPRGLIVDAGYPAGAFDMTEYSAKVLISENSWDLLYFSRQIIRHDAHAGNEVAIGQRVLDAETAAEFANLIGPLCEDARRQGYGLGRPRTMGFDFMAVRLKDRTHVFILECNARTTAVDYAMAVCSQAAERFNGQAAVVMENLSVPKLTHDLLRDAYLRGQPWRGDDEAGFLIGNAGCLGYGKATVFCIGENLEEAREVRRVLLPKSHELHLQPSADSST